MRDHLHGEYEDAGDDDAGNDPADAAQDFHGVHSPQTRDGCGRPLPQVRVDSRRFRAMEQQLR
ncbi:MAG: hypothetical protein HYS13_13465 [Planctomycetia bacterium]|nr:hypothetical protein [Planctomycetia bacterium]